MRDLHKRLERLEGRVLPRHETTRDYLRPYFKALENYRREQAGLEPLPYTAEDLEDDRRCLEETIPIMRADPGWQTPEAQAFVDRWEQRTRERIQRGVES